MKGKAGFVLPQYLDTQYIQICIGEEFGIVDIMASSVRHSFDFEKWIQNKQKLQRQFTVMSLSSGTEVLSLSIKDLHNMKKEFCDCYDELFNFDVNKILLERALKLQFRAIKSCKKQIRDHYKVENDLMSSSKKQINR